HVASVRSRRPAAGDPLRVVRVSRHYPAVARSSQRAGPTSRATESSVNPRDVWRLREPEILARRFAPFRRSGGLCMKSFRRGPWLRRVQCALLAAGIAALLGAGQSARAGGGTTVVLGHDVVRNLALAKLVGPVPASQPITVGVFLQNPNQA